MPGAIAPTTALGCLAEGRVVHPHCREAPGVIWSTTALGSLAPFKKITDGRRGWSWECANQVRVLPGCGTAHPPEGVFGTVTLFQDWIFFSGSCHLWLRIALGRQEAITTRWLTSIGVGQTIRFFDQQRLIRIDCVIPISFLWRLSNELDVQPNTSIWSTKMIPSYGGEDVVAVAAKGEAVRTSLFVDLVKKKSKTTK